MRYTFDGACRDLPKPIILHLYRPVVALLAYRHTCLKGSSARLDHISRYSLRMLLDKLPSARIPKSADVKICTNQADVPRTKLMTDCEHLSLLQGEWDLTQYLSDKRAMPYPASVVSRLGVPGFHITDGSRQPFFTESPCSLGKAASFDTQLEGLIAGAITWLVSTLLTLFRGRRLGPRYGLMVAISTAEFV
jgi:hypothetical protein